VDAGIWGSGLQQASSFRLRVSGFGSSGYGNVGDGEGLEYARIARSIDRGDGYLYDV